MPHEPSNNFLSMQILTGEYGLRSRAHSHCLLRQPRIHFLTLWKKGSLESRPSCSTFSQTNKTHSLALHHIQGCSGPSKLSLGVQSILGVPPFSSPSLPGSTLVAKRSTVRRIA